MKKADYERLSLVKMQLDEFRYAFDRLSEQPTGGAPRRFYYHSLIQYLVGFYIAGGGTAFFAFLCEYGVNEMANEIQALLDRSIGPSTLRQRIVDFRDKLIAHPQYRGRVVRRLKAKHDAADHRAGFSAAVTELLQRTNALAIGLENMLEALKSIPDGVPADAVTIRAGSHEDRRGEAGPKGAVTA